MSENSNIAWTDHTFNPWWGCAKVSPGCKNCYAATFAKRTGNDCWESSPRRYFPDKHWAEPLKWNAAAEAAGQRARVFCASMADVFEGLPEQDDHLHRLLALIDTCKNLDWQLLTKRPENIEPILTRVSNGTYGEDWNLRDHMPNVWLGTTVEDQKHADERIPILIRIPARVRFLSAEPLLGPVVMASQCHCGKPGCFDTMHPERGIHWVICGGESGAGRRPFDHAWADHLASQCLHASIPFFMKQDGGQKPGQRGSLSDKLWALKEFPIPA